ncbi:hypothetical protein QNO07_14335 [Streptomyces sp. 549]|uniref:hypothetical protein n=1 Tax=Streptomyces sp. 549 TaxID=3049076 RepID=UPI0024C3FDB4|nr:hypothetical protein [Streptomyces sp. 549]MDK1474584.1 hypothetical protein [Streptomyces sp. 549]
MTLSISGVLLFGLLVFLLCRRHGLKPVHALVCALFGFYLAGSALAPGIHAGGERLASLLGSLSL